MAIAKNVIMTGLGVRMGWQDLSFCCLNAVSNFAKKERKIKLRGNLFLEFIIEIEGKDTWRSLAVSFVCFSCRWSDHFSSITLFFF